MTFSVKYTVDSAKLKRKLAALPKRTQKKVVRAEMTSITRKLRKAMKKEAPKSTGQLRKSLLQKVRTYPSGTIFGVVGVSKNSKNPETGRNPEKYLHLVVGGTQAHDIQVGKRTLHHPGAKADDFVKRTADRNSAGLAKEFMRSTVKRIEAEARKG